MDRLRRDAGDVAAAAKVLLRIQALVEDFPEIQEVEVNPLILAPARKKSLAWQLEWALSKNAALLWLDDGVPADLVPLLEKLSTSSDSTLIETLAPLAARVGQRSERTRDTLEKLVVRHDPCPDYLLDALSLLALGACGARAAEGSAEARQALETLEARAGVDPGDVTGRSALEGLGAPSRPRTGFGLGFADLDHDGNLDVFVANGRVTAIQKDSLVAAISLYGITSRVILRLENREGDQ